MQERAVLFADVVGSTSLYRRLGDQVAEALIRKAIDGVTRVARLHGGRLVKTIGDCAMCELPDADAAALTEKLQPLFEGGWLWRHSAAELSALLALRSGDDARARTLIQKVADDDDAPARMRARATEILAVIGG